MPDAASLLAAAVRADGARPLLTMYDDATGERVELSVATFANWVAKTANLLTDELDLEPGEPVAVRLPPHWQTAVVHVAVLVAGGVPADEGRIAFWAEGEPLPGDDGAPHGAGHGGAEEVVGLSLRPMGGRLVTPPPGVLDFAEHVPGQGDHLVPPPGADLDVTPLADRVLTVVLDPLLPAIAGGGSLVLCRRPDPAALPRRAKVERCTAACGVDVEGLRRLPGPGASSNS